MLAGGYSYTFSYTVAVGYNTTDGYNSGAVDAKVGHTTSPYTVDADYANESTPAGTTMHAHTFSGVTDTSAGVAFTFTPVNDGTICFSNVSLVQN